MWTTFIVFILPLIFNGPAEDKKIETAIRIELDNFPEARLRDIYKNFFQDAYGPGHLIPDTAHAGSYLNYELQQFIGDTLKWQPVGSRNDYYRINLQLVKDGIIPRSVLLEAMVESASIARNPDIESWKNEWDDVMKVIKKMKLHIPDFEKDKKAIEEMFAKNEYVMHHSDHYNKTYNRHYRIVHKSFFNRWKEKYLNK